MNDIKQQTIKAFMDGEYEAFEKKFENAKTTDDCYTPVLVYKAVAEWVAKEYGVKPENMVRPFYPGGDYQKETYSAEDVVVDNPPFSILAEIVRFYTEHNVRFFLFAPALTLFTSSFSSCAIGIGYSITYANKARVSTSFLTNLEAARARTAPALYRAIKQADEDTRRLTTKELPKYAYPDHVLTATMLSRYSKYGIDFSVSVDDSERIGALDAQRIMKKSIFGTGYLLSEKAAAEKAAAEKAAAEKAIAEKTIAEKTTVIQWSLSCREREIIAQLSGTEAADACDTDADDPNQVTLF